MPTPTPWSRFYMPKQYVASPTGAPLPGAKLYFFESSPTGMGTSDPQDTFADSSLSQLNPNPVVADSDGLFPDIFLQQLSYRVKLTDKDGREVWTADPVAPFVPTSSTQLQTVILECTVDGNKQPLTAGVAGDIYVPFDCEIVAAVIQADQPGDAVVDAWSNLFVTNTPPTAVNSITAGDPVTLASEQSSIDTVLTGWDTVVAAGTAMRFNIESINTITRFTLSLIAKITVPG